MDWVLSLEFMPPITGYGDFSDADIIDLDYYLIAELIIQCANDHGIPVALAPEGDGIAFDDVPPGQSRQASEIVAGCTIGLNLPQGDGPISVTPSNRPKDSTTTIYGSGTVSPTPDFHKTNRPASTYGWRGRYGIRTEQ